jgi:tetratricopeptide (TPR) repeat protein
MPRTCAASPVELELERIRDLSRCDRHGEALAAAEALAADLPENREALYLIAANQRCMNRILEALATLQRLEQQHPRFSLLHQERGHCHVALHDAPSAIEAFAQAVAINPALATSWIMLDRLYRLTGAATHAADAAEHVSALERLPAAIVRAGSLFSDGSMTAAERILRRYLLEAGSHVEALRLLARIEHQCHGLAEAERLFESTLARAPHYRAAHLDYVRVLMDGQKYLQARDELDALLTVETGDEDARSLYAAACVGLGDYEQAIAVYRQLLSAAPAAAHLHLALGHALKAVGRQNDATESYLAAAATRPGFGDAYWSLANLKTYRFSDAEIAAMRAEEAAAPHSVDRCHLCFALGKALEDQQSYAESWQFYERGNGLKRAENRYDPGVVETDTRQQIEVCTAQFFGARAGVGAPDPDPIFILGLPRSGSTLIEQILASHSQVEGTQELADIQRIVAAIGGHQSDQDETSYPGVLADLAPDAFRRLGERYLTDTRAYRTDTPFFIDKMPNNFRHIGLIHLMMPNARIIDARREPMACCFSNLKQLFASGQEFSYSIEDIARYYRSYLELMRHWDAVLPGRVLRIWHEDVVDDVERSVRRILEFCGLEFEPRCVEFHKTQRDVRTASSEQVRQPIFRDGLFQWRRYAAWLDPLKAGLGDALIRYRE